MADFNEQGDEPSGSVLISELLTFQGRFCTMELVIFMCVNTRLASSVW
jgi:hypothetical protein